MKSQEFLQEWEKENNPFFPSEMKWDRATVNRFTKAYDDKYTNHPTKIIMSTIHCEGLGQFNNQCEIMVNTGYTPLGSVIVQHIEEKVFYLQQFIKTLD